MSKNAELHGQIALVTGAADGIGAAVVRGLVERGAHVAALDINRQGLDRLASTYGSAVSPLVVDVRTASAVEAAVTQIEQQLGPINLVANVAGILRCAPVVELANHDWETCWAVNASGVLHVCRAVARPMITRRRGSIVTVSSNAARVPRMHMAAYAASKAAATALTLALGLELAAANIRCNVVSPGSTDTAMQRALWSAAAGAEAAIAGSPHDFRLGIPLGRIAQPTDIAAAVIFLLSEDARHITLHDLRIDGGATLGA